jgi:V8-like Glu-specific endopeptidase
MPGSRRRTSQASLPLTPEQLLNWDNAPATKPLPEEIASQLRQRRLFVSGVRGAIESDRIKSEKGGVRGAYEIRLPPKAVVGLPGRIATRMPKPSRRSTSRTVEGFRPDWADRIFHPKRGVVPIWARRPVHKPGRRGEVFYGVFGADDRLVYYPSGYPWHCVGKVYAWTDPTAGPSWSGSGVLVGPRLALTAGHVVPWDASSWMMRFVPAYYDGGSLLGGGAESYVSDARGWDVSYRSRLPDAHDMAVLRLYNPLGDWLGFFGSKSYSDSWTGQPYWNITGYPGAIANAERPSYQLAITVNAAPLDGDARDVEHQGDATPGDSGGPFWATWPDSYPYVIGTVSGGEVFTDGNGTVTLDTNNAAGGNAVNDLIRWGRTNWP